MSVGMVYTEFAKDIEKYLASKLPEMPEHTAQEIGAHISNKMMICVNDMFREYERDMRNETRQQAYRFMERERNK